MFLPLLSVLREVDRDQLLRALRDGLIQARGRYVHDVEFCAPGPFEIITIEKWYDGSWSDGTDVLQFTLYPVEEWAPPVYSSFTHIEIERRSFRNFRKSIRSKKVGRKRHPAWLLINAELERWVNEGNPRFASKAKLIEALRKWFFDHNSGEPPDERTIARRLTENEEYWSFLISDKTP